MTQLRLGIVGCGAITEIAHLPAALTSDKIDLTALVDVSGERLGQLKRQYGLRCLMATDVAQIMSQVDAVILAIPNALHVTIGVKLLSAGIHVLCEKPLAVSTTECEQLCAAARKSSAVLAVGYMTRFYPSSVLTKDLLDSCFLGDIRSFDYEFGTLGGWAPLSGYNLKRETSGGGVLVVSGSHFIDRMLHFFSDVRVVRYLDDSQGGIEANCIIEVKGVVRGIECKGLITLSKTHRLGNRLQIVGEKGMLIVNEGQRESVTLHSAGSPLSHDITYRHDTGISSDQDYYRVQLEDFVRAIQGNTNPRVSGEQGAESVRFIEDCYAQPTLISEPWATEGLDRLASIIPA